MCSGCGVRSGPGVRGLPRGAQSDAGGPTLVHSVFPDDDDLITETKSPSLISLLSLKNLKSEGSTIPYDSNVETLQTALQILGFSLPKWGVDGKFGNETEAAVKNFQKSSGLEETGIATPKDVEKIISLINNSINKDPSKIEKVQKTKVESTFRLHVEHCCE